MKQAVAAILLLPCLVPLGAILLYAAFDPSSAPPPNVLSDERQVTLFLRSVGISLLATALSLVWGGIGARAVASTHGRLSSFLEIAAYFPLLLPPIVVVMGWVFLLGPGGPLASLGLTPYSEWTAAWVLSMCYAPLATLLYLQGLRSMDETAMDAARFYAGFWKRFWRIRTIPLLPYGSYAGIMIFLLSLSEYGIPAALRINVYPIEVFVQLSGMQIPAAVAYCQPPLAIAVALCVVRSMLIRFPPTVGHRSRRARGGAAAPWVVGALLLFSASVGVPVAMCLHKTGTPDAFAQAAIIAGNQALASLWVSACATAVLLLLGAALGWSLSQSPPWFRGLGDLLLLLTLVVPGAVVGLGAVLVKAFLDRHWEPADWRDTALLVWTLVCRTIAFPALLLHSAFSSLDPRLRQAADLTGQPWSKRACRISLPLLLPGLLAAAVVSFAWTLGEISASVLVNPPGLMTLPVRIASLLHFSEDRTIAALSLMLSFFVSAVFAVGLLLARRRPELRLHAD